MDDIVKYDVLIYDIVNARKDYSGNVFVDTDGFFFRDYEQVAEILFSEPEDSDLVQNRPRMIDVGQEVSNLVPHQTEGSDDELINRLTDRYSTKGIFYPGVPDLLLYDRDRDSFSFAEVKSMSGGIMTSQLDWMIEHKNFGQFAVFISDVGNERSIVPGIDF